MSITCAKCMFIHERGRGESILGSSHIACASKDCGLRNKENCSEFTRKTKLSCENVIFSRFIPNATNCKEGIMRKEIKA